MHTVIKLFISNLKTIFILVWFKKKANLDELKFCSNCGLCELTGTVTGVQANVGSNGTAKPGPLSFSQDCFGLNMLAGIRERRQSALSPLQQRLALL